MFGVNRLFITQVKLNTFVSYAHADAQTVCPDMQVLQPAGVEIWSQLNLLQGSA